MHRVYTGGVHVTPNQEGPSFRRSLSSCQTIIFCEGLIPHPAILVGWPTES